MKVTLLASTKLEEMVLAGSEFSERRSDQLQGTDAEQITEIAGRICYDSFGKGRSSRDYHKHIRMVGHGSVLEHSSITVLIQGVSRGFTHELIRHRVGTAVSQRSTRYVDEDASVVHAHPLLKNVVTSMDEQRFINIMQEMANLRLSNRMFYKKAVELVETTLVSRGVDKHTARKQARGAARGYLENGMDTELVFTMNLRAALNIIDQRSRLAADAEIREFAIEIIKICKKVAPAYFDHIRISNHKTLGKHVSKPARIRV